MLSSSSDVQVTFLSRAGIRACFISPEQKDEAVREGVITGVYQFVYFTPELLLANKKWRKMLTSDIYAKQLRAFVIDEAHTVVKW